MRPRIPEGDDWRDHATLCPHCGEAMMDENEHYVKASWTDPAWWECDEKEADDD